MSYAIVYGSISGNTDLIAKAIKELVGECAYFGTPADEAMNADVIFAGSWVGKNDFGAPDVKDFVEKLKDKKVFIFGTAGYDNTKEYFDGIIDNMKSHVDASNTIIGTFVCQGKVTDAKKKGLKETDPAKYEAIKNSMEEGDNSPAAKDIDALCMAVRNCL